MKFRVIKLSDLAHCNRLDPQHWLPQHKLEQCDPQLRAQFKVIEEQLTQSVKVHIGKIYEDKTAALEQIAARLRKGSRRRYRRWWRGSR